MIYINVNIFYGYMFVYVLFLDSRKLTMQWYYYYVWCSFRNANIMKIITEVVNHNLKVLEFSY